MNATASPMEINKMKTKNAFNRIAIFVCGIICLATVLSVCALTLASCGAKGSPGDSAYVKILKAGKILSAEIPVAEKVDTKEIYLFGINLWQDASDIGECEPLAKAKIKKDTAKAEIEISGNLSEALCKGYLFAKKESSGKYTPITGVYYVTNPRDAEKRVKGDEDDFDQSIKGAYGTVSELLELGASSTVVTVNLGSLMRTEGGKGAIPYIWNGLTYYADRDAVEALDKKIKGYTDSGIYVFLEIVQTTAAKELPEGVKDIVFDGVSGKKGYALNMTSESGAARICGMFDFLASRYGRGGEYGKASSFIIGRRINNMNEWYVGAPANEKGILNYVKAVRAAYNILLSHTPDGRVYVAMGNNWTVTEMAGFTVKDTLSLLNSQASAEGDFFWQVAVEANPSDTSDSSIWDDPLTEGRSDFLSPANIETLGNQLATDMYKFDGNQRHILLNHFTVGGTVEEERAASYAYAYYKCLAVGTVDGLMYGSMSGELDGLLTAETADKLTARRKIADVFATIDDENHIDFGFVSALVRTKWDRLYKKYSKEVDIRSTIMMTGGGEHSNDETEMLADFSNGNLFGFVSSASSEYVELRYSPDKKSPALYAVLEPSSASDKAGVSTSSVSTKSLKNVGYLGLTAKVESASSSSSITVIISGFDKKGKEHVCIGEATVSSNSWEEVYFNIGDFVRDIDDDNVRVSVLARSGDATAKASGLWISRIVTEAPQRAGFPWWIFIVLGIIGAGVGGYFFVKWFKKNYVFVKE